MSEKSNGAIGKRAAAILAERSADAEADALAQAERELSTGQEDADAEAERIRLGDVRIQTNSAKRKKDRATSEAIKALTKAMAQQDAAAFAARRADAACINVGLPSDYAAFRLNDADLVTLGVRGGEASNGVCQLLVIQELYLSPPSPPPPGPNMTQERAAEFMFKALAGGPPETPIKPYQTKE